MRPHHVTLLTLLFLVPLLESAAPQDCLVTDLALLQDKGSIIDFSAPLLERIKELNRTVRELNKAFEAGPAAKDIPALAEKLGRADQALGNARQLEALLSEFESANSESKSNDAELRALAQEEMDHLRPKIRQQLNLVRMGSINNDPYFQNGAFVQIIASTSQDAKIKPIELLGQLYLKVADAKGYDIGERFDVSTDQRGGITSMSFMIEGKGAYGMFRQESGRHSVQVRGDKGLPVTNRFEVKVSPIIKEQDIHLDEKDLEILTSNSGGPGGQNVNKTQSRVQIRHIPTGIIVTSQEQRSQQDNKKRALQKLSSLLIQRAEVARLKAIANAQSIIDPNRLVRQYDFAGGEVTSTIPHDQSKHVARTEDFFANTGYVEAIMWRSFDYQQAILDPIIATQN